MQINSTSRYDGLRLARLAGLLYIIIFVANDASATANNIKADETLFRVGIGGQFVVLLSEVILSVLLYVLLAPVNKTLALVAAAARLTMTAIHGLNLLNYFLVLQLLGDAYYLALFDEGQLHALVMLFIDAHAYGFGLGLVFFALHLVVLGYLVFRSSYFPRLLGALLMVAACGYAIDSVAILLLDAYQETPPLLVFPIVIAEVAFPLWLLIKGVRLPRWEKAALQPA